MRGVPRDANGQIPKQAPCASCDAALHLYRQIAQVCGHLIKLRLPFGQNEPALQSGQPFRQIGIREIDMLCFDFASSFSKWKSTLATSPNG